MLYGAEVVFFWDKYKTHKYSVGRTYSCWMLNLLVHHVTSRLQKIVYFYVSVTYWNIFFGPMYKTPLPASEFHIN